MITKEGLEFLRASAQNVGIDGHFDLMALDNMEGVFTNHMDALVALAGSDEIAKRVAEGHGEADHDGFMGSDGFLEPFSTVHMYVCCSASAHYPELVLRPSPERPVATDASRCREKPHGVRQVSQWMDKGRQHWLSQPYGALLALD